MILNYVLLVIYFALLVLLGSSILKLSARIVRSEQINWKGSFILNLVIFLLALIAKTLNANTPQDMALPIFYFCLTIATIAFALNIFFKISWKKSIILEILYLTIMIGMAYFFTNIVSVARLSNDNLQPFFSKGDYILSVRSLGYDRGDFVTYDKNGQLYLRRVLGVPGETVTASADGYVLINDKKICSSVKCYMIYSLIKKTVTLQANEYFVSNEENSMSNGQLPYDVVKKSDIIGKTRMMSFNSPQRESIQLNDLQKSAVIEPSADAQDAQTSDNTTEIQYANSLPDTSNVKKHKGLPGDTTLWYDNPVAIDPINFYTEPKTKDDQYKCWIAGERNGKRIVLAAFVDGPGGPTIDRFIETDVRNKNGGELQFDVFNYYSDKEFTFNDKVVVGRNYDVIPSLEVPRSIYGPENQLLTLSGWSGMNSTLDKTTNKWIYPDNPYLFDKSRLKTAFVHPLYGTVYTSKMQQSSNIFDKAGFYIPMPDGTYVSFFHTIPITEIKWKTGNTSGGHYISASEAGCSLGNFATLVDQLLKKDLIIAGNMNGRDIYVYKDSQNKALTTYYEEYKNAEASYAKNDPNYDTSVVSYAQFIAMHPIFFFEDDFGRLAEGIDDEFNLVGGCGKPVIYLYPQKEEDVSVQVDPTNGRTITIPDYGNGWNVHAYPDGKLLNLSDGKNYQYLFWEGHTKAIMPQAKSGFMVSRSNLSSFFDQRLAQAGLVGKEISDFKDFWVSKLQENTAPYFFINFVFNDYMDKAAPLTIEPRPDTVIRLFMDWQPLQTPISVPKEKLVAPARSGFTVVEWGGSLY